MGAKLRGWALVLSLGLGLSGLVLMLTGCGSAAADATSPGSASLPPLTLPAPVAAVPGPMGLPAVPQDAGADRRHVSDVASFDGVSRYADSGTGISPLVTNNEWLIVDGTLATPAAWAIWRFPVPAAPNNVLQLFTIDVSVGSVYYVAYGDYARGRWEFYDLATHPNGQTVSITLDPSHVPGGETALHSPGGFAYIAILAVGKKTEIKDIALTTPVPAPPPGQDSIFDQFEPNDTLATAYTLTPGVYHASIHQSSAQMASGITRDPIDCYSVDVPAGKTLTLTLRHEVYDHFGSGSFNDCDILFYTNPGASSVYNDFDEALSSVGIYYDPFEQVNWVNTGGDVSMKLAIVGDTSQPGVRNNAEYDLGVFVSDSVHQVSGKITQNGGQDLVSDVVAFLVPGNFNANTPVPGSGVPGGFIIQGVPPGTYTLMVHSSARLDPAGYVWAQTKPNVVVTGGDVGGVSLDLDHDPPSV